MSEALTSIETRVSPSAAPVVLDPAGAVAKLGLIALSTDLTIERDFAAALPSDRAGVFAARVLFENPTTPENLRKMAPRIGDAAALILPGEDLAAICYGCTSASVVIGDAAVAAEIHRVRPGVPVVTPASAAIEAFGALGARRIAVLTPYVLETSIAIAGYFERAGLDVARLECLGLADDRDIGRVSAATIRAAAARIDTSDVDALFLSCTALPAFALAAELEAATAVSVVTSNQACAWALAGHAGLSIAPAYGGRLFGKPYPGRTS